MSGNLLHDAEDDGSDFSFTDLDSALNLGTGTFSALQTNAADAAIIKGGGAPLTAAQIAAIDNPTVATPFGSTGAPSSIGALLSNPWVLLAIVGVGAYFIFGGDD